MKSLIHFCLHQKLVVLLLFALVIGWGVHVAPFERDTGAFPRNPVPVDAIPDLGDNQQIVYTDWPGRSPQDVEDQVTYPLTVSLLGVPGVREVRSFSMFGSSYVYLIFEEDIEFYWSRARVLEKLNSLPPGLLPSDTAPALGPDATGLGQILWYTLEGRDPDGNPVGGWDLDELRAIQDWQVRYALLAASGVAEVASVGGYVRQYQVDVDPDALRAHDVTLMQVADAVRKANQEIGARNLEINGVEYFVRATGYVRETTELESAVVVSRDSTPVTIADVATVNLGPEMRRGALDVNGADAAGGVVTARYGANPLKTIRNTKQKIDDLTSSMPIRAVIDWKKTTHSEARDFAETHNIHPAFAADGTPDESAWLDFTRATDRADWPGWLTTSRVTIVPFYDRSQLIAETLSTLDDALYQQVLVSIIVVIVMVLHLRASLLISSMLPLAVLMTFIAMKQFGVDANIVALAGIAIAIGTVVDVGIVLTENILKHLDEAPPDADRADVIVRGAAEVAPAVTTSVATTVISFLPVLTMTGEAGRLFIPLALTKNFAMIASIIVALTIIPPIAHLLFGVLPGWLRGRRALCAALTAVAGIAALAISPWLAAALWVFAAGTLLSPLASAGWERAAVLAINLTAALAVVILLTLDWMPLGLQQSTVRNLTFVLLFAGFLLIAFKIFEAFYPKILRACLAHKAWFLAAPAAMLVLAACIWLGFERVFAPLGGLADGRVAENRLWDDAAEKFPGLGREFRPPLDEGSFLVMPTVSAHASIDEVMEAMRRLDSAIASIPEVDRVVGKLGRAETPLDPAPISMIETVVNYLPEFKSDAQGRVLRFRTDERGNFLYGDDEQLIEDRRGRPFRQWRPHIRTPSDIWDEIARVSDFPGLTGAPMLQPIETRLVMLRTGMRAPMGIKVKGNSLESIERFGVRLETLLRSGDVPGLSTASVNADRIVGKPYLEITPDRDAAARHGLNIADVHDTIAIAVGGAVVSTTIEGRERFPVQVRYAREKRDSIEAIEAVLIDTPSGARLPLSQVAEVRYSRGPQMIRAEDTFLTGYVTFSALSGHAEVDVVEAVREYLIGMEENGELIREPGIQYEFAGNYQSALEFARNLRVVLPLSLGAIFILLYLNNRSVATTLIVFSGIAVAWSGGFLLLWLYGRPGFLDVTLLGANLRDVFQISPINLSTAVWVGFLALFGIATDDGVVMSTYLRQRFAELKPTDIAGIRQAVVEAGMRRVRPCLMTTATTMLALLPVLTSTGRGSDLMAPMAVPIFGGMLIAIMTMFVVPVLYCAVREARISNTGNHCEN